MNYTLEPLAADAVSEALELLLTMHRIRFLEEKISELRRQGDIQGSVHLCIGQEAIYAGACAALQRGDRVFSTNRGHGWALACGVPSEGILAELLARETGVCRGRGGSAYFSAVDWGFYGENSIVGAGAPIACGAALASLHAGDGARRRKGSGAIGRQAVGGRDPRDHRHLRRNQDGSVSEGDGSRTDPGSDHLPGPPHIPLSPGPPGRSEGDAASRSAGPRAARCGAAAIGGPYQLQRGYSGDNVR